MKAVGSGAAPASASLNSSEIVDALTDADEMLGAIVSGVLFTTAFVPKFAVSFSVGTAVSRIRSPDEDGCE